MNNSSLLLATGGGKFISAGGRTFYRHDSGMGTVIEFYDNAARKVLVLDAAYRGTGRMTTSNTNTSLKNYTTHGYGFINTGLADGATQSPAACESLTDATINSIWFIDTNTGKQNTDVWVGMSNADAAKHCRDVKVNGVACNIPNFQTLQRIYCEGTSIDALDPTLSQYPQYGLSNWMNGATVWSSTEYGTKNMWFIINNGYCSYFYFEKGASFGIVPVLEL